MRLIKPNYRDYYIFFIKTMDFDQINIWFGPKIQKTFSFCYRKGTFNRKLNKNERRLIPFGLSEWPKCGDHGKPKNKKSLILLIWFDNLIIYFTFNPKKKIIYFTLRKNGENGKLYRSSIE